MSTNVLWVGDLDPLMDDLFLRRALAQFADHVLSIKIIKNKQTGASQGYGFIEFRDDGSALKTLHSLNGKPMPGTAPPKRWKLNMAHQGRDNPLLPDFAIFIGDLEYSVDDLQLFNFFSARFSSVKSARVVVDEHGDSRGYGFVRFADENDQQRALTEMQGVIIGTKPIRVSIAAPKNVKQSFCNQSMSWNGVGVNRCAPPGLVSDWVRKMGQTPEQQQQMTSEQLTNYYASYLQYHSYYQQWQQQMNVNYEQYYKQYYPGYYGAQMPAMPGVPPAAVAGFSSVTDASMRPAAPTQHAPVPAEDALIPHDQKKIDTSMNSARRFIEKSKEFDRTYDEVWWKYPAATSLYD
ncbi:tRNA selenocysteine 1-associated protein 1-like isoform X1 [Paramacrobiotus metropolitanus]|uniref:tRNA selenocysteine 1-associated protein 1-like isoform X1 n=1 Tax=Paramacrobiotus metropolitanus TaxID=2943436 RepID=UPI0024459BE1|nr:tRNA selenocysteine 1-associated protein 1-like isoform X1 [Paramacrobiotus metropolitanus]XP_055351639.1 tRNA selenocysteine 1-associated protein 1-like isoform X1 [Paramacrobiotus metropolitanus]